MRTVKFEKMKSVGQKYKGTKARSVIAERARSWKQIPVASLKRTMSLKRLTEPPEKKNRAPSNTAEVGEAKPLTHRIKTCAADRVSGSRSEASERKIRTGRGGREVTNQHLLSRRTISDASSFSAEVLAPPASVHPLAVSHHLYSLPCHLFSCSARAKVSVDND